MLMIKPVCAHHLRKSGQRLPVVFHCEGGGGRPGDTDVAMVGGLDLMTFRSFAALSGKVARIGVAGGCTFAGNAALFGMCDVTIDVEGASIGMGGPAMIEGGGLGVVEPAEVGPVAMHVASGAVDILARDDAHAAALARQAVSYFQGRELCVLNPAVDNPAGVRSGSLLASSHWAWSARPPSSERRCGDASSRDRQEPRSHAHPSADTARQDRQASTTNRTGAVTDPRPTPVSSGSILAAPCRTASSAQSGLASISTTGVATRERDPPPA